MAVSISPRSTPRRWRWAAGLAGLSVLLGACGGGSGFAYVSSSDRKAYFKVPADWKFYDKREILVASGQSLSSGANEALPWLIGYDSHPDPAIEHVLDVSRAPDYPVVLARVQRLNLQTREGLSLSTLRNVYYPVDRLVQANAAEILNYHDGLVLPGGYRGITIEYDVILGGISNVSLGNDVIRVHQAAVVDPATEWLYLFTIRCESHCYRDNKTLIDQIAESWTVKER